MQVHHPTIVMPTSHRIPSHSLASERLVFTVGEAGECWGISRAFAYELVARVRTPGRSSGSAARGPQDRPAGHGGSRLGRLRRDDGSTSSGIVAFA